VSTDLLLAGSNDNLLQLSGLKNGIDDSFINNATIAVSMQDATGADAPGMTWPAAMAYVPDSQGCYRLLLDSALNLIDGRYYTLSVSVEAAGLMASWKKFIKATGRT